jgi:hypothetical protein
MLDIRSASIGLRERLLQDMAPGTDRQPTEAEAKNQTAELPNPPVHMSMSVESSESSVLSSPPAMNSPPPNKIQISLQDMITTSIALKSGLDLDIVHTSSVPDWPTTLSEHKSRTRSPSRKSIASASVRSPSPELTVIPEMSAQDVPSHVTAALAALQREVLMLRCELNFELWMARNNVKHIGRLYQDRVVSRFAEVERQGLVSVFSRNALSYVCIAKRLNDSTINYANTRARSIDCRKV